MLINSTGIFRPRHGQPADVVVTVVFLASRDAGWITGSILPVDGGVFAGRSPAMRAETAETAA